MMAVVAMVDGQGWGARTWPMTREALDALEADAARLAAQTVASDGYVTGHLTGEIDAPRFVPNILGQQLLRQLTNARDVLASAAIVDDPGIAVIGRRVTLVEPDGAASTYVLGIPGDGDLRNRRVSVDSPVGSAILGRRVGEPVTVVAPAGSWTATVARIE